MTVIVFVMTVIVFVMIVIVLMNVTLVMYYSYESPFTMAERRDYYTPGPLVPDVLTMQDDHRSSVIWDNQGDESSLGSRSSARLTPFHELDSRIRNGIIQTGMSGFLAMRQFPRWRGGTAARSSQLAYGEERRDVTLPPPEPAVPAYVLPPLPPLTIDLAHIRGARRRQPRVAPPRERPADPIPPPVYFHFDPTATTDRRGEYYGPTQYYGSTSTSASQPPWHQTYFPQGPQVSSYQVPPSSMPFFEPSYGQTAYTTSLGTPPASQFQQATPPASQFRQATPPASPFQQTTPPPFAASDQYYRPAPYTDAQPFTSFDQCYRPTMPSDDQPSTSHSRPSSSHQAQDPSQLHFTLSESWLFGPEIGSEAYEELLSRPDLTPPSFRLLPPTQEETGTAPPAADVQHSAQDEDASDSGESPPVPRQFHSITDSSRHRRETHGLRVQRPRTRRYED
ncbi:extensin-like [Mercurialis annua]|uniref:extensin-like n=1 Tax=Mercurialis annua TaxID=3986 RepID=UPI0024AE006A|nr:extensin-like [Mercurialis annua]